MRLPVLILDERNGYLLGFLRGILRVMKNLTLVLAIALAGCGGSGVHTNKFAGSYTGVEYTTGPESPAAFVITPQGCMEGSLAGSVDDAGKVTSTLGKGSLYEQSGALVVIVTDGTVITTFKVSKT